jgi:hypothetical protein
MYLKGLLGLDLGRLALSLDAGLVNLSLARPFF